MWWTLQEATIWKELGEGFLKLRTWHQGAMATDKAFWLGEVWKDMPSEVTPEVSWFSLPLPCSSLLAESDEKPGKEIK